MDGEKRRDHRQSLKYPAKVDFGDGQPPRPCLIIDVSASGARINVEDASAFPDRCQLLLAEEHGTARRCNVVWRKDNQVGLEFIKPAAANKAAAQRGTATPT